MRGTVLQITNSVKRRVLGSYPETSRTGFTTSGIISDRSFSFEKGVAAHRPREFQNCKTTFRKPPLSGRLSRK